MNREAFEAEYSKGGFGIAGCDLSKHADGSYINDDAFSAFFWFKAGLASQAQQSQWISVEERLPDHTDDVLCYCIALFEPIATIKTSHLNPAKTGFYVEYDNGGLEPLEKVTHWMPLPPAPVSDNEQPEGE